MKHLTRIWLLTAALTLGALLAGGSFAQEALPVAPAVETVEAPGEVAPAPEPVREGIGATSNPEPINWLMYGALALNAVLIPLGADLLKRSWAQMPSALKTILPLVAGSLITAAEAYLLGVFGVPIDLSLIEQVILGGGVAGLGATVAFKKGEAHGRS